MQRREDDVRAPTPFLYMRQRNEGAWVPWLHANECPLSWIAIILATTWCTRLSRTKQATVGDRPRKGTQMIDLLFRRRVSTQPLFVSLVVTRRAANREVPAFSPCRRRVTACLSCLWCISGCFAPTSTLLLAAHWRSNYTILEIWGRSCTGRPTQLYLQ
jgi:hypothetical protein